MCKITYILPNGCSKYNLVSHLLENVFFCNIIQFSVYFVVPEIVKNLNTENITTTSISLRWDKPIGNASFYFIQVLGEPAFNKNVTTTSDIIEGLTPGNYFTFLVSTFVDKIQGSSSAIANYTSEYQALCRPHTHQHLVELCLQLLLD